MKLRPEHAQSYRFLSGFTLVELLVVISIIALLLAILMPALSAVREQGKTVVCKSNQRNAGMAFEVYCNENNGYFPSRGNAVDKNWTISLGNYLPRKPMKIDVYFLTTYIATYTYNCAPCLFCPSHKYHILRGWAMQTDYIINENMFNTRIFFSATPMSEAGIQKIRVTDTAQTFVLADGADRQNDSQPTVFQKSELTNDTTCIGFLHNQKQKKANFLFVDGHVESYDKKTVTKVKMGPFPG